MNNQNQYNNRKIFEGLRYGDLENYVSELFTIDKYKSKMGDDKDVVVIGFKVKEKYPALDLVEFVEKGFDFILDADISAGEEYDGKYQVFVEIERTPALTEQLKNIISGLGHLTKNNNWKFKYQKDSNIIEFNEDNIKSAIPMTQQDYEKKILEFKNQDIQEFFNQGAVETELNELNELTFKRPYAQDVVTKFVSIGNYDDVKKTLPGALDLTENSQSQIFFLNKYLGNYEINKIGDKFLVRNNDKAIVIEKKIW